MIRVICIIAVSVLALGLGKPSGHAVASGVIFEISGDQAATSFGEIVIHTMGSGVRDMSYTGAGYFGGRIARDHPFSDQLIIFARKTFTATVTDYLRLYTNFHEQVHLYWGANLGWAEYSYAYRVYYTSPDGTQTNFVPSGNFEYRDGINQGSAPYEEWHDLWLQRTVNTNLFASKVDAGITYTVEITFHLFANSVSYVEGLNPNAVGGINPASLDFHSPGGCLIVSYLSYNTGTVCAVTPPPSGGSVAAGTMIALANGNDVPVENLKAGMKLLSYDMGTQRFITTTITRFETVVVHNEMTITTADGNSLVTDQNPAQKLYAMLPDGSWKLLPVTELKVGYKLFEPESQTWAHITQIEYVNSGTYLMYDIYPTAPGNYIANGYLDPVKT